MRNRILVVEPRPQPRLVYSAVLGDEFAVDAVAGSQEALAALRRDRFELMVCGAVDGLAEILREAAAALPGMPRLVLTERGDSTRVDAPQLRAPFSSRLLLATARMHILGASGQGLLPTAQPVSTERRPTSYRCITLRTGKRWRLEAVAYQRGKRIWLLTRCALPEPLAVESLDALRPDLLPPHLRKGRLTGIRRACSSTSIHHLLSDEIALD